MSARVFSKVPKMGSFLWSLCVVNMAKWQITWSSVILCLWILFSPSDAEDGGSQIEVTSLLTASARPGHCCSQSSVEWEFTSTTDISGRSLAFQSQCLKDVWSLWSTKIFACLYESNIMWFSQLFMESGDKLRNWVWCWESKASAKLLDAHFFSLQILPCKVSLSFFWSM